MSFPSYADYRDSGVEWIGKVPTHWRVVRLGALFCEIVEAGSDELPVLSVSIHSGVSDGELSPDEMDRNVTRSDDRTKYKRVQPNDLVYNMMRAWQGGFGAVQTTGMVSPAYVVARPTGDQSSKFVERVLRTPNAVDEIRRYSKGVTDFRLRLYWDEFKSIQIALPPKGEETVITAFLDRETAKIDALVEAQQRLIELLNEKRQAIISRAISNGLDPAAANKASGVQIYGLIPANWAVTRLRSVVGKIESGTSVNSIDIPATENAIGVLKTSSVYSGELDLSENKTVLDDEVGRVSCPIRAGTIIVSRMNTPDLIGAAGLSLLNCSNIYLPDRLWQVDIERMSPEFVHYWTKSEIYRHQIKLACAGTSSSMQIFHRASS